VTTGIGSVVNGVTATATASGGTTRATGIESYANSGGSSANRPGAIGVFGVSTWTGAADPATDIVGVVGKAVPGAGVTSVGVLGESNNTNGYGNTGMLALAANSTASNTGVAGTANVTDAQAAAFGASLPAGFGSGVVGYNPANGDNQYAGYFYGDNSNLGLAGAGTVLRAVNNITNAVPSNANSNGQPVAGWFSTIDNVNAAYVSGQTVAPAGLYGDVTSGS